MKGKNQWQGDQVRSYFSSSGNRRLEPNQGDSWIRAELRECEWDIEGKGDALRQCSYSSL